MEGRIQLATTSTDNKSNRCYFIKLQDTHYKWVTVYFDPDAFSLLGPEDKHGLIRRVAKKLADTRKSSGEDVQFYVTKVGLTGNNTCQVISISNEGRGIVSPTRDIHLDTEEGPLHWLVEEAELAELSATRHFPDVFKRERDIAAVAFNLSAEYFKSLESMHKTVQLLAKPLPPKKWSEATLDSNIAMEKFPELAAVHNIIEHKEKELDEYERALNLEIKYARKIERLLSNNTDDNISTSTNETEKHTVESLSESISLREKQLEEDYQALELEFDQSKASNNTRPETTLELKKYIQQVYSTRLEKLNTDLVLIQERKKVIATFLSLDFVRKEKPFTLLLNLEEEMVYVKKLLAYALQQAAKKYFGYARKMGESKEKKFNKCFKIIALIKEGKLNYQSNLPEKFTNFSLQEIADFITDILKACEKTPTGLKFLNQELQAVLTHTGLAVIDNKIASFNSSVLEKEKSLGLNKEQAKNEIEEECRAALQEANKNFNFIKENALAHETISLNIAQQRRFIDNRNRLMEQEGELASIHDQLAKLTGDALKEPSLIHSAEDDFHAQDNRQKEKVLQSMEKRIEALSQEIKEADRVLRVEQLKTHITAILKRFPEKPEWEDKIRQETYWKVDHNWPSYLLKITTLKSYAEKANSYSLEKIEGITDSVAKLEKELQADLDAFTKHFVAPKSSSQTTKQSSPKYTKEEKGKSIYSDSEEERDSDNEQEEPTINSTQSLLPAQRKTIIGKTLGIIIGGSLGATLGAGLGALAGFFLAPVTFGASVPLGASIGAVVGGGLGGLVGGGVIGLGIGHLIDTWWQKSRDKQANADSTDSRLDAPQKGHDYPPSPNSTHAVVGRKCKATPGKATPTVSTPIVESQAQPYNTNGSDDEDFEATIRQMYDDSAKNSPPTHTFRYQ